MLLKNAGFHTLTISHAFTSEYLNESSRKKAINLLNEFVRHGKATGEFEIYSDGEPKVQEWSNDKRKTFPFIKIEYKGKDRGVRWKIWFINYSNDFQYYAIEATINPKILVGEKDYIIACNASYLNKMRFAYNELVRSISDKIPLFENYATKRLDCCINFNLIEMRYECTTEQMMTLMKRGKIPHFYKERTVFCKTSRRYKPIKNSFYLESGCVTINCYDKESETKEKHPDKPHRIETAKGIIRYEVQYYQFKLYPIKRIISKEAILENPMIWKPSEFFLTEQLISDEAAHNAIVRYFSQTIMMGDYYVLSKAVKMVKDKGYCSTKEERLIKILKLINQCRGVDKAAKVYVSDQKSANDFNRSLEELNKIGLNPVTIPREWGIDYIPNLLKEYRESMEFSD